MAKNAKPISDAEMTRRKADSERNRSRNLLAKALPTAAESNLIWGPLSLGVGAVLTVAAAMTKDVRWLLLVAWPSLSFGVWRIFAAKVPRAKLSTGLGIGSAGVLAAALMWLYWYLRPLPTGSPAYTIERGIEAVMNCYSFQRAARKRMTEAASEIQEWNTLTAKQRSEMQQRNFAQWKMGIARKENRAIYTKLYRQKFADLHRLISAQVPEAIDPVVDYDNPRDPETAMDICPDLHRLTAAFIEQQRKVGNLKPEEAERHLKALTGTH